MAGQLREKFRFEPDKDDIPLLEGIKKIADYILEEDQSIREFYGVILAQGIKGMLRDVIIGYEGAPTTDREKILWQTIVRLFFKYPKEISNFVVETLKTGEMQQRLKRMRKEIKASRYRA